MAGELELAKGIKTTTNSPADGWRGPYQSIEAANLAVPEVMRQHRTVDVIVDGVSTEHHWVDGVLVRKYESIDKVAVVTGSIEPHSLVRLTGGNELTGSRVYDDGTTVSVNVSDTGSFFVSGAMRIKGDLVVEGKTTLVQTIDPNSESLVVSGAMSIVQNMIKSQIISASLNIENLGVIGDRNNDNIIDLGGFF
jgi:hypothetical protein